MTLTPRIRLLLAAGALLAACTDGGGGGGGGGGGTNRPPQFTSTAAASVAENAAGTVYTATAADPDGDSLSFSISGGPDAGDFTIAAASGELSFLVPPDFEGPDDANGDNIYEVTLRVSDGAGSDTLALAITVTNVTGGVRVRRVSTGFASPLFLAGLTDGSGRVYVVERAGVIEILNPETDSTAALPFADLSSQISTQGEGGLLGFALAPDFAASGVFYVNLTNVSLATEIRRYRTMAGNRDRVDTSTTDVILTFDQPSDHHNGGWIDFGPDGMLYVATGDGGTGGAPAQDRDALLGKILRIDVSGDDFPGDDSRDYAIPPGNPFASGGGAPEVWAMGLRNPFRASFDATTGDLFIGDVGEGAIEEIDRLGPGDGGANLGWPFMEGTQPFSGAPPPGLTPPVAEYAHGTGPFEGDTVIGGRVARGSPAALSGEYVFADFIRGNVWSVPETSLAPGATLPASQFTQRNADFAPDFGAIDSPTAIGADAAGALYIVDIDGDIFRIEEED